MKLDDVRGRATITVEEAGDLLGLGRNSAYQAAKAGQIPTLQFGRRLVVPVPRLLSLLGVDLPEAGGDAVPDREWPAHA